MKTYTGERTIDGCVVLIDGQPLDDAQSVLSICADGFEWSYDGDGPAQLALALLHDHFGDAARALAHYQAFTTHIVANFDNDWEMTGADIDRALSNIGATAPQEN